MTVLEILKSTTNSAIYKKARKHFLEDEGDIRCSFCPYHDGENCRRHRKSKCWKRFRKTQYKTK